MLLNHLPLTDAAIGISLQQAWTSLEMPQLRLDTWNTDHHLDVYQRWVQQGTHCGVIGVELYANRAFTQGSTGAIESFIMRWPQRRVRISRAEFFVARMLCQHQARPWRYLEDDELKPQDLVIVSVPFSGNGGLLPDYQTMLDRCHDIQVPVCLDLAYIGIASGLDINLDHPAVAAFTVSISKPISTLLRHGIRFTRERWDDVPQSFTEMAILPRANIAVASSLMTKYTRDYIPHKYLGRSHEVCKQLGLENTNVLSLALGDAESHNAFYRGGFYRVCITQELMS